MRNPDFSSVDPKTGDVTWKGTLSIEKGDHSNMPARSNAYLPGDERGHVNASSLGGDNSKAKAHFHKAWGDRRKATMSQMF